MVLLDECIEHITDYIYTNVTSGTLGTSSTTAQSTDTGLISPDATTTNELVNQKSTNQILFSYSKLSTTGEGNTYREFGIKDSVNNVDWTRFVFPEMLATDYEDWHFKCRIFVRML